MARWVSPGVSHSSGEVVAAAMAFPPCRPEGFANRVALGRQEFATFTG